MSRFLVPYEAAESEFTEKRSRFISHVWPVTTEEEAQARIREMKARYHDARHNCWCYLLREGRVQRYSDDGEPQGSAGQPMCFDGRFTLLTPSDTGYEVAFSSVYRSPDLSDSLVFAFGQGKLAVADADDDSESERYRLSVFDATGLLFTGTYRTGGGYYTAHSLLNSSSVSLTWQGTSDGS